MSEEYVVLDFETSGMSPPSARVIEVGAVKINRDGILDTFSELISPGIHVPFFITEITGISNQILKGKPKPDVIMPKLNAFIGDRPIIAHNASFDAKFYVAEMQRLNLNASNPFLCTLMLARRLIKAPDYKLTTLVSHLKFKVGINHQAHRALDDALMTVQLWHHLHRVVSKRLGTQAIELELWHTLMQKPKAKIDEYFDKLISA